MGKILNNRGKYSHSKKSASRDVSKHWKCGKSSGCTKKAKSEKQKQED